MVSGCIPPELKLPSLPQGPQGERGKQGIQGPPGKPGKGLSSKELKAIDLLINNEREYIVESSSYSFGFALSLIHI